MGDSRSQLILSKLYRFLHSVLDWGIFDDSMNDEHVWFVVECCCYLHLSLFGQASAQRSKHALYFCFAYVPLLLACIA
jgi:hypothetical protein